MTKPHDCCVRHAALLRELADSLDACTAAMSRLSEPPPSSQLLHVVGCVPEPEPERAQRLAEVIAFPNGGAARQR
jgi:hypothetical protein